MAKNISIGHLGQAKGAGTANDSGKGDSEFTAVGHDRGTNPTRYEVDTATMACRARKAKTARRLDWNRDSELERTYDCVNCGREVVTEHFTDVTSCSVCDGQSDGDCLACDDGVLFFSPATVLEYRDSRSMLCHDGRTFLCGPCACGDEKLELFSVMVLREPTVACLVPTAHEKVYTTSLTYATEVVGKRSESAKAVAILRCHPSMRTKVEGQHDLFEGLE